MLLVGLTGGIGSGKSTVGRLLAERGAIVLDADDLARRAVDPGAPGFDRVAERFGPDVVSPDGALDRERLARVVFADDAARRDLEAIVHPEVYRMLAEEVERRRDTGDVVVFDAPLIVETGFHEACDVVVVVTAPEETVLGRLRRDRGMPEGDARARLRAQAPVAEKQAVADEVIRNDGSLEDLERAVEALWVRLRARAGSAG